MTGHGHTCDSAVPAVRHFFDPADGAPRHDNLRNNLAYQRFYVDHSRIPPQTQLSIQARGMAGK